MTNTETLDYGGERISRLFRKIFIPTVLGMLADVAFMLTDGIFVGHGVGLVTRAIALLPRLIGTVGLWLAVPAAEVISALVCVVLVLREKLLMVKSINYQKSVNFACLK